MLTDRLGFSYEFLIFQALKGYRQSWQKSNAEMPLWIFWTAFGPLLDRIDMQIQVNALPHDELLKQADAPPPLR